MAVDGSSEGLTGEEKDELCNSTKKAKVLEGGSIDTTSQENRCCRNS